MAAITVTRYRRNVIGNRVQLLVTGSIANTNDTYASPLKIIESVQATSVTNNAIGATSSGGTVTFKTGGAESGALIEIIGQ